MSYIITDQLGRNFNLSAAWEYYLTLETEDNYPPGKFPTEWSVATLVTKTVTGSKQFFPQMTLSKLINDVMPGLNVSFFNGFGVATSGEFWYDTKDKPSKTIQPTYTLWAGIAGSQYRSLLKQVPEAATWTNRRIVDEIEEREIPVDMMFVNGLPYLTVLQISKKIGVQFFEDAKHVFDLIEEKNPGAIAKHPQRTYIERNIRAPFEELKRLKRLHEASKREADLQQQKLEARRSGIIT